MYLSGRMTGPLLLLLSAAPEDGRRLSCLNLGCLNPTCRLQFNDSQFIRIHPGATETLSLATKAAELRPACARC